MVDVGGFELRQFMVETLREMRLLRSDIAGIKDQVSCIHGHLNLHHGEGKSSLGAPIALGRAVVDGVKVEESCDAGPDVSNEHV